MTEHEKTRLMTQFPIVYNAHIKVKSVFYFVLKSILLSDKKEKTILKIMQGFLVNKKSAVFIFQFCKNLIFVSKVTSKPGFLMRSHICRVGKRPIRQFTDRMTKVLLYGKCR